jgi:hypothetical protein
LLEQALAQSDTGRLGDERNEEVMLTGQSGLCDLGQDLADDTAKRVLGQNVVPDVVLGHVVLGILSGRISAGAVIKYKDKAMGCCVASVAIRP